MICSIRGTSRAAAEAVEVEFRIAVKIPLVEKLISSPRLRIRLRWTNTYNNYEISEVSRINSSLAQVLRVRVNPSVNSRNIFIYDVSCTFLFVRAFTKLIVIMVSQKRHSERIWWNFSAALLLFSVDQLIPNTLVNYSNNFTMCRKEVFTNVIQNYFGF